MEDQDLQAKLDALRAQVASEQSQQDDSNRFAALKQMMGQKMAPKPPDSDLMNALQNSAADEAQARGQNAEELYQQTHKPRPAGGTVVVPASVDEDAPAPGAQNMPVDQNKWAQFQQGFNRAPASDEQTAQQFNLIRKLFGK